MCLPALSVIRERFPRAHIAILAKPWVADLYRRESFADEVILYNQASRWKVAGELRASRFDCAILLQNACEAAWIAWLARIPNRIGYRRDGRGLLLTQAITVPKRGEIPRHERFYYLELLRRAGIVDRLPESTAIRLTPPPGYRKKKIIGVSPGAPYWSAKQLLAGRLAAAARKPANSRRASIGLFR